MLTTLFSHILTVSISMAAVIAAAFVLMHLFGKNFAARTRYLVWTILILRLCIPMGTLMVSPLVTLEVTPSAVPAEEAAAETAEPAETEYMPSAEPAVRYEPVGQSWDTAETTVPAWIPETGEIRVEETKALSGVPESVPEPSEPVPSTDLPELWNRHILPGICVLWLTVALVLFFGQICGYLRLMGSMRRTMLVADPETKALYQTICEEMQIRRPPKLAVSALAGSPMVCGFFRTRVILPDMQLDPHALRGILTHELIHYRRGDVWRKLAALFARSLHWFNPLVHLMSARFMSDMEMACDEAALLGLDEENRRVYGMVMLDIVKRCHLRSGQLTTRFNPRKSAVKERFRNIMDTGVKTRGWWIIGVAAVLCLGAGVFVACEVKPMETEETGSPQETEETSLPEEIPVEAETEEIPGLEEIPELDEDPVVEVLPEGPDAEEVLPPETAVVEEPGFVPVEVDRTKYALPAEKDALVYTGYRVDYNAEMHMTKEYSRWYVMQLPQIAGEDEWNQRIADKYFHRYGSLIDQLERGDPDIYKFFSVSYEVILWEDTCTIAIRHHGGSNASGAVGIDYDIHHYNRKTGEFLSTDEFLDLYTDGKWNMKKLMILANGYGFSRDETGNIWEIPEENFQGVIPSASGNGLFDLCFQGVSYEGAIASRVMVTDYKPYETTSYTWTDLGGGTHTTKAGQEYFWLATNVDAGYRLSVYYPLDPPTEYAERRMLILDTTLAPDCPAPQITFSEEAGRVFLHLTGKTLDGEVQDQVFLCREPESSGEWFEAYTRGWIGETRLFRDDFGWTRNTIMDAVNGLLETYAAGGDVIMHIANQEKPEEAVYPFIPVRTAVDWDEMREAILPGRKQIGDSTWLFPIDLGSGYTMEVRWGIGGMGDSYTGYIESVRITTGADPITAWRPNKGDGLLFAEEFGDTGEWLLSYTSADGQPALYKAYYTDSGKVVHEPQVLGGTRYDNARAIGARYTEDGQMLVLIEAMDREETEAAYVTFAINAAEKKTVIGAPDLVEWWMDGAPVRFPNHNMPHSGDTLEEIAEIPCIVDGGNGTDINTGPARYIAALLTGDADTLAELSAGEAEMYRNVLLYPEKYTVWLDENDPGKLHFLFLPEERSVLEGMQTGWNHYIVEEGMLSIVFMPVDRPAQHYDGAAAAVAGLLNSSLLYEFPKTNDMDRDQRQYVTDYILSRLWNEEGSTAAEIAAYAKTYLGISDFTPSDSYAKSRYFPDAVKEGEPERYIIPGHGGWSVRHRITGVTENSDGTVDVKVQFYADHNRLVLSHRYTYTMREIDGEWAFVSITPDWQSRWDILRIAI
ncbi:MAG: hypothetical protein IJB52_03935 [Clostridia bacterium]|nr:hypothetical protein [Clostridia bacterium]